ncbi:MAG: phosphoglycerate kinase [Parcubacteria group bacterium CG10_big_fil_rev_8_21_14_0_10_36_14]|nr:MAG: phosphoglycerate kinase [Parcubacteria group bacterium CG10_big_fil_rev_8_21_14_0_10_36_14]
MKIKSIKQIKNLKGKRALVRVDYNLPINKGRLDFKEDLRIRASFETIRYLWKKDATIILISHLGRPEKREKSLSLAPIAKYLSKELLLKVNFMKDDLTKKNISKKIKPGINLLENIRFYKEEESDSKEFAEKLAKLGDIFINEAFSVSHRNNASICCIQNFLPSYAGLHLEEEIKNLSRLLSKNIKKSNRPYIALMGGAKISTKINLISSLLKSTDFVLLGGALISNILKLQGYSIGNTFVEKISKNVVEKICKNKKIILPIDVVVGKKDEPQSACIVRLKDGKKLCKNNEGILDIGPETVLSFSKYIKSASTLVWNGPVGYFENTAFAYGTFSLARLIASRGKGKTYAVVGGGETISALDITEMEEDVDWISTGGGAMLAFLAGESMPGLKKIVK